MTEKQTSWKDSLCYTCIHRGVCIQKAKMNKVNEFGSLGCESVGYRPATEHIVISCAKYREYTKDDKDD